MKIILTQGNPGPDYMATRHNIGFRLANALAESQGASFQAKSKFKAEIAEFSSSGEKILIVKPTTFYNQTGFTARALCDFYKVDPSQDLLVICDDLSLPFGTVRTRQQGSDAGNNGLKSIISTIGDKFPRIKIGIANPLLEKMDSADFVLNRFSLAESEKITPIFDICFDFINDFLEDNFENLKKAI